VFERDEYRLRFSKDRTLDRGEDESRGESQDLIISYNVSNQEDWQRKRFENNQSSENHGDSSTNNGSYDEKQRVQRQDKLHESRGLVFRRSAERGSQIPRVELHVPRQSETSESVSRVEPRIQQTNLSEGGRGGAKEVSGNILRSNKDLESPRANGSTTDVRSRSCLVARLIDELVNEFPEDLTSIIRIREGKMKFSSRGRGVIKKLSELYELLSEKALIKLLTKQEAYGIRATLHCIDHLNRSIEFDRMSENMKSSMSKLNVLVKIARPKLAGMLNSFVSS
jgi:hypothetical protein